ncbi:MAG TPA: hypothetical protein VK901_07465, partial [Nitrospiraceae bacterium]|nr:hypothetical protein [Nitrospiraceae bacterium]
MAHDQKLRRWTTAVNVKRLLPPRQSRGTSLGGLVRVHLLVRAAGTDGAIEFQHQLFQEWYAAAEVEELM